MTDLEKAARVQEDIKDINQQIKAAEDMKAFAIKHNDEIGKQIWSRCIRELRQTRHDLHESVRYVELTTFTQVVKTYLTPDQYKEAWERVGEVLKHPELIQN